MRRIAVTVYEQIREWTRIEVEVPDGLDLANQDALDKFLEAAYASGEYRKDVNKSDLSVDEREFNDVAELLPTTPAAAGPNPDDPCRPDL